MKSIHSRAVFVAFALSTFACGSESSVIGGRCRDGLEQLGNTCMAPAPGVTLVTPGDPPVAASPGSDGAGRPVPSPLRDPHQVDPNAGAKAPAVGSLAPVVYPIAPAADPIAPAVDPIAPAVDPIEPTRIDPVPGVVPLFPEPPPAPAPLVCATPLVACHGVCISVASDAENCGACGKICPSNICGAGECQGATPGDVVLIGHDYSNAWSGSAQAKVLVNALTIPTTDPIRVLSYEDGGSADAVNQAKALAFAGIRGRSVEFTVAPSAAALTSSTLARSYDIVLIHDASAGDPVTTGTSWSSSLGTFTMKGGVVIALDRGTSPMPQLVSSTGLLAVGSHTKLPDGTHLAIAAAGDVVGAQVLNPYAAFGAPVSFQGLAAPSADLGWVVRVKGPSDTLGDAVVVHRIVR